MYTQTQLDDRYEDLLIWFIRDALDRKAEPREEMAVLIKRMLVLDWKTAQDFLLYCVHRFPQATWIVDAFEDNQVWL